MNEIQPADFNLDGFQITDFSFVNVNVAHRNLDIEIIPSGLYTETTGIYQLSIKFTARHQQDNEYIPIVKASLEAYFKFHSAPEFNQIPSFFYANSIAIVFPYLRSFISTLCLQANVPLVILPLFNLTSLEPYLRDNTKSVARES